MQEILAVLHMGGRGSADCCVSYIKSLSCDTRRFMKLLLGPLLFVGSSTLSGRSIAVGGPAFGRDTGLFTCYFLFFMDTHWTPFPSVPCS